MADPEGVVADRRVEAAGDGHPAVEDAADQGGIDPRREAEGGKGIGGELRPRRYGVETERLPGRAEGAAGAFMGGDPRLDPPFEDLAEPGLQGEDQVGGGGREIA